MKRLVGVAIAMLGLSTSLAVAQAPASPQATIAPAPIVRATIDPPRVVVGQGAMLHVEVLAPNYMTSPPIVPDFQVRNAVTRQGQSINTVEQHDGTTYAGVRFEFVIFPLEPGSYAMSDQKVTVKYAADPPHTREATIAIPPIEFQSFIPAAAAALNPYVAATDLAVRETLQQSSDALKVGGSVTRTITIRAQGVPAMLLPPVAFPTTPGLAVYRAQPILQDQSDARAGTLSATRVDAVTYMLQEPGDYLLPAVTIRWWNLRSEKVETAHLDTIALHVGDDPAAARASPSERTSSAWSLAELTDLIADYWWLAILAIAAVIALVWTWPRIARAVAEWYGKRREAWLASEAWAFACLRAAARRRNAGKVYTALLNWLQRFEPVAPKHTVEAFKTAARDSSLDRQIDALERALFAPQGGGNGWSARDLIATIRSARRRLRRQSAAGRAVRTLPQALNPVAATALLGRHMRPVAR